MAKKESKKKGKGADQAAEPEDRDAALEAGAEEEDVDPDELAVQLPAFDAVEPAEYLEALGIQQEHVLAQKASGDRKSVTVVTKGGVTLVFPGDEEKALKLTDSQRDGQVHQASHMGHLFKK